MYLANTLAGKNVINTICVQERNSYITRRINAAPTAIIVPAKPTAISYIESGRKYNFMVFVPYCSIRFSTFSIERRSSFSVSSSACFCSKNFFSSSATSIRILSKSIFSSIRISCFRLLKSLSRSSRMCR
ncbi:unnamed protein product [Albugo candida]|uniref:Uncharacterized protein n=1 Tax=Albugo candida TaxID=65357 RepID=A0A024GTM3_9STRA|nr:unnamed protein product [Albugo candida]|eukprot:CCI49708.1 unnamed protein product [Albugo candida]